MPSDTQLEALFPGSPLHAGSVTNWADASDEFSPTLGALSFDVRKARGGLVPVDAFTLDEPSLTVQVTGLPQMCTEDELGWFFGEQRLDVVGIELGRGSGISSKAELTFADKSSYEAALKLSGTAYKARKLTIVPYKTTSTGSSVTDAIMAAYSKRGGGMAGPPPAPAPARGKARGKGGKAEEPPKGKDKGKGKGKEEKGKGKDKKEEGKGKKKEKEKEKPKEPPKPAKLDKVEDPAQWRPVPNERPKLKLAPRTKPLEEVGTQITTVGLGAAAPAKVDPFGGAKPITTTPTSAPVRTMSAPEPDKPREEEKRDPPSPVSTPGGRGQDQSPDWRSARGKASKKGKKKETEMVWRVADPQGSPTGASQTEETPSSRGRGRGKGRRKG